MSEELNKQIKILDRIIFKTRQKLSNIKEDELSIANLRTFKEVQNLLSQTPDSIEQNGFIVENESNALSESELKSQKVKVMIIDDDEDVQRTMQYLLPKKGDFLVISVLDPLTAIQMIRDSLPNVILMDLMMPNLSGFELLKKIKKIEEFRAIKIIIGSSRSYDKDRIAVLESGANEFIPKPYNFGELMLRIKHFVN